ncbi:MAG: flagellin [Oscillospiraceae bacterium]
MGMVVRTNTMSTNAYRQLGTNNTQLAKSLEKLSSGYRINRAGDDASGLAISEKMKAQIQGLTQASANSQDGISLVQTAEGALTEVHSMLNRMVSLATKSANGTIQDNVDRDAIQTEVDSLNTEITRIGKSTNFNGINLLDGSLGGTKNVAVSSATVNGALANITTVAASKSTYTTGAAVGVGAAGSHTLAVKYTDAGGDLKTVNLTYTGSTDDGDNAAAIAGAITGNSTLNSLFDVSGADGTHAIVLTSKSTGANAPVVTSIATNDPTGTASMDGTSVKGENAYNTVDLTGLKDGDSLSINGKTYEIIGVAGEKTDNKNATGVLVGGSVAATVANLNTAMKDDGIVAAHNVADDVTSFKADPASVGNGLVLQVGDSNDSFNKVTVKVGDLTAEGLGTAGLDVSSQTAAGNSISTIKAAINTVSTNRGNLGALQNRLEYAINSMDTTTENMDAANSRIRDTDMAKEMMNYTKMNILSQAAQAMLAQANQNPQSILQLLQ